MKLWLCTTFGLESGCTLYAIILFQHLFGVIIFYEIYIYSQTTIRLFHSSTSKVCKIKKSVLLNFVPEKWVFGTRKILEMSTQITYH